MWRRSDMVQVLKQSQELVIFIVCAGLMGGWRHVGIGGYLFLSIIH